MSAGAQLVLRLRAHPEPMFDGATAASASVCRVHGLGIILTTDAEQTRRLEAGERFSDADLAERVSCFTALFSAVLAKAFPTSPFAVSLTQPGAQAPPMNPTQQ